MMTFHEAVNYYNARRKYPGFHTLEEDTAAFDALVQKVCDLEAQVKRLEGHVLHTPQPAMHWHS